MGRPFPCLGADLLKMSREDLVQICGPADGIRLFNAIKGRWVLVSQGSWLQVVAQPGVAGSPCHVLLHCAQTVQLVGEGVGGTFLQRGGTWRRRCWELAAAVPAWWPYSLLHLTPASGPWPLATSRVLGCLHDPGSSSVPLRGAMD